MEGRRRECASARYGRKRWRTRAALLLCGFAALAPGPAGVRAQDAQDDEARSNPARVEGEGEDADAEAIEEITIRARRREESVQDAPLSISAFSGETLRERGVRDLRDLTFAVPNLGFDTIAGSSKNARIFIRGIGQHEPFIDAEPGVGLYINGVYRARSLGGVNDLLDVAGVEVLRGPQGSLYGKNSIGGALMVELNKPAPDLMSRAEVSIGSDHYYRSQAILNLPLVEDFVLSRFALSATTRDGYIEDAQQHTRYGDTKDWMARGSLRFLFEDLTIDLTGEQGRQNGTAPRGECHLLPPGPGLLNKDLGEIYPSFGEMFQSAKGERWLGASYSDVCDASAASDEHRTNTDLSSRDRLETWSTSGTLHYDLYDLPLVGDLSLTSISSWQRIEQDINAELDGTPFEILHVRLSGLRHTQFSQELRVAGGLGALPIDWVGGLFYFREASNTDPVQTTVLVPGIGNAVFGNGPDDEFDCCSTFAVTNSFTEPRSSALTYAGYLEASVDWRDRLHLSAGLRRSVERKDFDRENFTFVDDFQDGPSGTPTVDQPHLDSNGKPISSEDLINLVAPTLDYEADTYSHPKESERFAAWTWAAYASYDLSDDLMIYATLGRGFRSGGFNNITLEEDDSLNEFDPETLLSHEVGFKSRWFDDRLTVNVSAFYDRYEDIQQRVRLANEDPRDGSRDAILNTGDATKQGLEVELFANPVEGLTLSAGAGIIDASYRSFRLLDPHATQAASCAASGIPGNLCGKPSHEPDTTVRVFEDLSDNEFQLTPRRVFNASAAYTFAFPGLDLGQVTLFGSYYQRSKVHNHIFNHAELEQGKYGVWNARVSLLLPNDRTEISAWVDNIADRRYLAGGLRLLDFDLKYHSPPRYYGITISHTWD